MLKKILFLALFSLSLQTITYATERTDRDEPPSLFGRMRSQFPSSFMESMVVPPLESDNRRLSPVPFSDVAPQYPQKNEKKKHHTTPTRTYFPRDKKNPTYYRHQPMSKAQKSKKPVQRSTPKIKRSNPASKNNK